MIRIKQGTAAWYLKYTSTEYWKNLKRRVFDACGWKCEVCGKEFGRDLHKYGKRSGLQGPVCHHLTYERIGCELISDMAMLCKTCHIDIHRTNGRIPSVAIIYNSTPPDAVLKILRWPH